MTSTLRRSRLSLHVRTHSSTEASKSSPTKSDVDEEVIVSSPIPQDLGDNKKLRNFFGLDDLPGSPGTNNFYLLDLPISETRGKMKSEIIVYNNITASWWKLYVILKSYAIEQTSVLKLLPKNYLYSKYSALVLIMCQVHLLERRQSLAAVKVASKMDQIHQVRNKIF